MSGRTNGLAAFFQLVGVGPGAGTRLGADRSGEDTPAHTVPNTPGMGTPVASPSRRTSLDGGEGIPHPPTSILPHSKVSSSSLTQSQLHHSHSHSHNLLHAALRPSYDKPSGGHETEYAVGTFESQRYLNLEATRLWDPNREERTREAIQALGER